MKKLIATALVLALALPILPIFPVQEAQAAPAAGFMRGKPATSKPSAMSIGETLRLTDGNNATNISLRRTSYTYVEWTFDEPINVTSYYLATGDFGTGTNSIQLIFYNAANAVIATRYSTAGSGGGTAYVNVDIPNAKRMRIQHNGSVYTRVVTDVDILGTPVATPTPAPTPTPTPTPVPIDYSGGLLDGEVLNHGYDLYDDSETSSAATDNDESTSITLDTYSTDNINKDALWFEFPTSADITSFRLRANVPIVGQLRLHFLDADGNNIIPYLTPTGDGSEISVSASNVKKILVGNVTETTSINVSEISVYGTILAPTPTPTPVPTPVLTPIPTPTPTPEPRIPGLLGGKIMHLGQGQTINHTAVTEATDLDLDTSVVIDRYQVGGTGRLDHLNYRHTSAMTIGSYRLKASTDTLEVKFYNASNVEIAHFYLDNPNDEIVSLGTPISNVRLIAVYNLDTGTQITVQEVDFFEDITGPTPIPTVTPTPTVVPTPEPTVEPTPTVAPTATPEPTVEPTVTPTEAPTPTPTVAPTATPEPTVVPIVTPDPTVAPTPTPTIAPTPTITPTPTAAPTIAPTPTVVPTVTPAPTTAPTVAPPIPTVVPTIQPTVSPGPPLGSKPTPDVVVKPPVDTGKPIEVNIPKDKDKPTIIEVGKDTTKDLQEGGTKIVIDSPVGTIIVDPKDLSSNDDTTIIVHPVDPSKLQPGSTPSPVITIGTGGNGQNEDTHTTLTPQDPLGNKQYYVEKEDGTWEYLKPHKDDEGKWVIPIGSGTVGIKHEDNKLSDISDSWAKDSIEKLVNIQVIKGYGDGTFRPDEAVTRAEYTSMLVRAMIYKYAADNNKFVDVSSNAWYYNEIAEGQRINIIKGVSADQFAPDRTINREETLAISVRWIENNLGYSDNNIFPDLGIFGDGHLTSNWAKEEFAKGLYYKLIDVSNQGEIAPKKVTTRAEVADILVRLLENY